VFANGYDDTPGAVMVDNVTCFKDRLVVQGRADGRSKCWVLELNSSNGQYEAVCKNNQVSSLKPCNLIFIAAIGAKLLQVVLFR
jgi:hypothetical protein